MERQLGTGPLIVYVDDMRANRVVFEQSMGAEFNVQTVADGSSALEILEKTTVAILVTDIRMPTMSGEELLRAAKELSPRTIRIVVTAYSDVDPVLRVLNERLAARYMVKPWDRADFVQLLRWAIESWMETGPATDRSPSHETWEAFFIELSVRLASLQKSSNILRELHAMTEELKSSLGETRSASLKAGLGALVRGLDAAARDCDANMTGINKLIEAFRRGPV